MALQSTVKLGEVGLRYNRNSFILPDSLTWKVSFEEALYQRALANYSLDSFELAYQNFTECIRQEYEKGSSLRWIGIIYLRTDEKEKACGYLKNSMQQGDAQAFDLLRKNCW